MSNEPQNNPYQTPVAQVAQQNTEQTGTLIDGGRKVPAGNAINWIAAGWNTFKSNPGGWVIFALVFMIVIFAMSIIPLINILAMLLMPVLFGGYLVACRDAEQGEAPAVGKLFSCFSTHFGNLALVGLLYLIGAFAITFIMGLLMAVIVGGGAALIGAGGFAAGFGTLGLGFILVFLISLALMLPLIMAFYYAPPLIVFHNVGAIDAMRMSFSGSIKNILPFLLYGVLAMIIVAIGMIPLFLGLLVTTPILMYSMYASYKDIYVA